jgi:hypothetical protein
MTEQQVASVAQRALQVGVTDHTLASLRAQFRGMHLTFCNDDDVMNAVPFLTSPGLNIYLVDGREHCMSLTRDLEAATGLLLAEVSDEEE